MSYKKWDTKQVIVYWIFVHETLSTIFDKMIAETYYTFPK